MTPRCDPGRDAAADWETLLCDGGALSRSDLARARETADRGGIPLEEAIVALGLLTEDQIQMVVADRAGLEFVFPSEAGVDMDLLRRFPLDYLRRRNTLPILLDSDTMVFAFSEPPDAERLAEVEGLSGCRVRPVLASRRRISRTLERVGGVGRVLETQAASLDASGMTCFYHHLTRAAEGGVQEVRFEPVDGALRVRYRLDDVFVEDTREAPSLAAGVATRARLLGDLPQGSRTVQHAEFEGTLGARACLLRLSVVPTLHGDAVIVRITDASSAWGAALSEEQLQELAETTAGGGLVLAISEYACRRRALLRALASTLADARCAVVTAGPPDGALAGEPSCDPRGADLAAGLKEAAALRSDVVVADIAGGAGSGTELVRLAARHRLLLGVDAPNLRTALLDLVQEGCAPACLASVLRVAVLLDASPAPAVAPIPEAWRTAIAHGDLDALRGAGED